MSDDDLTLGTHTESRVGDSRAPSRPHSRHSPLNSHSDKDEVHIRGSENHEPTTDTDKAAKPQNVRTNYRSPTTTTPPTHHAEKQLQQQQQMSTDDVAAFNETLMRALSGEDLLENFLRKYPRPTPGSGVGVGPIISTTQGTDRQGRPRPPDYYVKRHEKLREKRRRLRELQDWDFRDATTPPRRANSAVAALNVFAMAFILFGLHYTGHFKLDTVVPAMAINGGGLQFIAGLLAWTQGQTFAYVSFISTGGFFLAITCVWMLPNQSFIPTEEVTSPSKYFTGAFYAVWGVFTCFLLACTPRMNLCLFLKFLTAALSLLCLTGGLMAGNETATHVGGYFAIISGAVSWYLCFASLLNEVWDMELIPIFQTTRLLDGSPLCSSGKASNKGADEGVDAKVKVDAAGSSKGSAKSKGESPAVPPAA